MQDSRNEELGSAAGYIQLGLLSFRQIQHRTLNQIQQYRSSAQTNIKWSISKGKVANDFVERYCQSSVIKGSDMMAAMTGREESGQIARNARSTSARLGIQGRRMQVHFFALVTAQHVYDGCLQASYGTTVVQRSIWASSYHHKWLE